MKTIICFLIMGMSIPLWPMEKEEKIKKLSNQKFIKLCEAFFGERKIEIEQFNIARKKSFEKAREYIDGKNKNLVTDDKSYYFIEEVKTSHDGFKETTVRIQDNKAVKEEYFKKLLNIKFGTDSKLIFFVDFEQDLKRKGYSLRSRQKECLSALASNFVTIYYASYGKDRDIKGFEKEMAKIKRAFKSTKRVAVTEFESLLKHQQTNKNLKKTKTVAHIPTITRKRSNSSPKRVRSEPTLTTAII